MDNRINELRRKIRALRMDMFDVEAAVRDQIDRDRDCEASALRLLRMRQDLMLLITEWSLLGGGERLPTIEERLRENYRAMSRPRAQRKPATQRKQKIAKRRLVARS
jgi:hypothetical protein